MAEPVERWSLPTRIAFRFFCAFFLLYFPIPMLPPFGLDKLSGAFWNTIVVPVGKAVFGVEAKQRMTGSGDTTWDFVHLFVIVTLALAITLVWSVLDRKSTSDPRLLVWSRVYVRFALASAMIEYGLAKVIPIQFAPPSIDRLTLPFGQASPMGLLWTFMGSSTAYTIFGGLGELVGGLLLTTRRTALLGALITAGVMANVAMMNFSYDVPVKLYSSILLLAALYVAAPDAKRLLNLLVLNRPTEAKPLQPRVLESQRWHNAARVARTAVVALFISQMIRFPLLRYENMQNPARHELYGIWNVDELKIDGVVRPPLLTDATRWRRVIISGKNSASIQLVNDERERYGIFTEPTGFLLRKGNYPKWQASFVSRRPDPNTLMIQGTMDGQRIEATLRKAPEPEFLLKTRGFHWISEIPYNR